MRYTKLFVICLFALLAVAAPAQEKKPDFSGKWRFEAAKSSLHSGKMTSMDLVVEQKGSSIHVVKTTRAAGKESVSEFTCTTDGKDCESTGQKISLWYNCVSLVELDITEALVFKSSMKLSDDGKSMTVEVSYVTPECEEDQVVLSRI